MNKFWYILVLNFGSFCCGMESISIAEKETVKLSIHKPIFNMISAVQKQPAVLKQESVQRLFLNLPDKFLNTILATHALPELIQVCIAQTSNERFLNIINGTQELLTHALVQERLLALPIEMLTGFVARPENQVCIPMILDTFSDNQFREICIHADRNFLRLELVKSRAKQCIYINDSLSQKALRSVVQAWTIRTSQLLEYVVQKLYGTRNVSPKNENNIRKIAQQMGCSDNFIIKQMHQNFQGTNENVYAFTLGKHIFINEKLFEKLIYEQQEFVVGHELSHLISKHSYQRLLHATTYSALIGVDFFSLYFHGKLFKHVDSKIKKLLIIASAASTFLASMIMKDYLLEISRLTMHEQEYEADRFAVESLRNKKGALSFFDLLFEQSQCSTDTHSHPSIVSRKKNLIQGYNKQLNSIRLSPQSRIMRLWKSRDDQSNSKDIYAIHCGIAPAVPLFIAVTPEIIGGIVGGAAMLYGYIKIGSELYTIYNLKKDDKSKVKRDKLKKDSKKPKDPKDPKNIPPVSVIKKDKSHKKFSNRERTASQIQKKENTSKVTSADFMKKTKFSDIVKDKTTVKVYGDRKTFTLQEKINHPYLKKGDKFELDLRHGDHVEVYDKRGLFKCVLNMDGTLNPIKTIAGKGRVIQI